MISVEELPDRVVARTRKDALSARLLAGADDVESVVVRSTELLAWCQTGVAIEAELAVPPAALDMRGPYATFDFGVLSYGYGRVFPKRSDFSVEHPREMELVELLWWQREMRG